MRSRRRLLALALCLAAVAVALPSSALASSAQDVRSADHVRKRSDRSLVLSARKQRACVRTHPQRCAGRWIKLQRAGLRLEQAELALAQASARARPARSLAAHQEPPALTSRKGRLRWSKVAAVHSYLLLRSAPGMARRYSVVSHRSLRPPAIPGTVVSYRVRSLAGGAAWSAPVRVAYAAKRRDDPRSAPVVTVSGTKLAWSRVGSVNGYIVVRTIASRPSEYSSVRGTRLQLAPVPGATASYSVRTAIRGSAWSPPATVTFPAVPTSASPSPSPASFGNPFAGQRLYVDPNSSAAAAQRQLVEQGNAADAALIGKLASTPTAKWFGDWSQGHGSTAGDVSWWVGNAAAAGTMPVIVAYDLPWRDCGQYSAGGAAGPDEYKAFIDGVVQGIAGRKAAVIVEPDALAGLDCQSADRQSTYYSLLNYAVARLASSPNTAVYLDGGHSTWRPAATIASRLQQAGVAHARGFSLNVSNFKTTASETAYAAAISAAIPGGSHAVIDTSRNGRGPTSEWCNPSGRGLGTPPTTQTGSPVVDALLWIKTPGASDGTCNGGPAAGQWFQSYALELARNAVF